MAVSTCVVTSLSLLGAGKSLNLGLGSVGPGGRCGAAGVRRGLKDAGSARKGLASTSKSERRSGSGSNRVGYKTSGWCDFFKVAICSLQMNSRCQHTVFTPLDYSCTAKGARTVCSFIGFSYMIRSSQKLGWPLINHNSTENLTTSPAIIPSGQQDGTEDSKTSTSTCAGYQPRKLSHFRVGHPHWSASLVGTKFRNQERDAYLRDEERYTPGAQIGGNTSRSSLDEVAEKQTNFDVSSDLTAKAAEKQGSFDEASDVTVICFDIETTGLSVRYDRIIEFAARDLAGGECSTIETLVNPQKEVKNEYIHNISSEMVNNPGVPRWKEVAPVLLNFVESRRKGQGPVILVAHNSRRFDVPFIMNEFDACGLSIPSFWRFADSLTIARLAVKSSVAGKNPIPSTALGQLFTFYKLPSVGDAHRAMVDVNMLAYVLQMLMNDLQMSTSELLAQSFGADEIAL